MKIRKGFVSNSSSSSFVVFGFKATSDELISLLNLEVEEPNFDIYEELEDRLRGSFFSYVLDDGPCIVGKVIAREDCDQLEDSSSTLEELKKWEDEIVEEFGVSRDRIILLTGTRQC